MKAVRWCSFALLKSMGVVLKHEAGMRGRHFALALLCVVSAAIAQSPPHEPANGGGGRQLERLTTLLDLTDAQKARVKTILEAEHAKMRAQFESAQASGTKPSFEQMRAAREQMRAETVQQLTPVLTPAQLKKFEVLMEEHHGQGRGPHGPPPAGDAPSAAPN
jgi:Spy/CpxP family protein refolding chaperone